MNKKRLDEINNIRNEMVWSQTFFFTWKLQQDIKTELCRRKIISDAT